MSATDEPTDSRGGQLEIVSGSKVRRIDMIERITVIHGKKRCWLAIKRSSGRSGRLHLSVSLPSAEGARCVDGQILFEIAGSDTIILRPKNILGLEEAFLDLRPAA